MKLSSSPSSSLLLTLGLLSLGAFSSSSSSVAAAGAGNNSSAVTFDHYSLLINGERSYIWAGEFHYWRLPVPHLWRDVLEKFKAHGFNTVSLYGHWGFHAPSPISSTLDFNTPTHDPRPILQVAKEIGLWVIFRPGPYVNAESHSGGHAQWVTNGRYGALRNNDPRYTAAWKPYMAGYWEILAPEQIGVGGNMIAAQIENEFWSMDAASIDYMRLLKEQAREKGIVVPLTHNNPNMNSKAWSTEYLPNAGSVDISGFDTYPYCWSCVLSECGGRQEYSVVDYYDYFTQVAPNQPPYIPEFQGGSYSPWGSPAGNCITKQNSEFVNIMYRHNLAERLTMVSVYVFFGGTNWGNIGYSPAVTSYDYSAGVSESRQLQEKYKEGKSFGLFLNAAQMAGIAKTDRIYAGTDRITDNGQVFVSVLQNPDTKAKFYILRHDPSNTATVSRFTAKLATLESDDDVLVSGILEGLGSKILVTDFEFAPKQMLRYSSAEVLTSSIVDDRPVLVLWLPNGESGVFSIPAAGKPKVSQLCSGCSVSYNATSKAVSFKQEAGISILDFPNSKNKNSNSNSNSNSGPRVVLVDRGVAWSTYVPKLSAAPDAAGKDNVIVHGPHLVRSVATKGRTMELTGDTDAATALLVHASKAITRLTWNGRSVATRRTKAGLLSAQLSGPKISAESVEAQLNSAVASGGGGGGWKHVDCLPEIAVDYDDSAWTVANLTKTSIVPAPVTLPVLYAEDYDFFHGYILFRGRFDGASNATSVELGARFGNAGGFSVWLNGEYVGSSVASIADSWNGTFKITPKQGGGGGGGGGGKENVLVVLMDHNGKDQNTDTIKNYRGLHTARLSSGTFTSWKIQGNAGGVNSPDRLRGPYNEGGLYAERLGWHLPGLPSSVTKNWSVEESNTLTVSKPGGVQFFRKSLKLDVPTGYDVPVAIKLAVAAAAAAASKLVRVQIWVNGYQFGKFIPAVGNQEEFPVPAGVLDYAGGRNEVAVSVWSQEGSVGVGVGVDVEWVVLGVYESSFGSRFEAKELREGWKKGREVYA